MLMPRRLFLMISGLSLAVIPFVVSLIVYGGLPAGFGIFPPQQSPNVPGFSLIAFMAGVCIALGIAVFLIFPRLFGFKPVAKPPPIGPPVAFPFWFWLGLALWLVSWAIMWIQPTAVGSLVNYTFVPLWWGFILTLDGWVYRRTGGASLLVRHPLQMLAIAVASCFSWYFFEYLDYFVFSNWYYPYNTIFSQFGYIVWYGLAYTTVMPSIFEWYNLLTTFDFWRTRYANGPQIALSRRAWWVVFWVGIGSLVLIVIWPFLFFSLTWISPLLILGAALMLAGYWTPFTPLAKGNWSMLLLMGLGALLNYFLGEMWNFWSRPNNPNFWMYDVPFVNVLHIFEMPLLGFFGYIPFGIMCWVWWIHNANFLGVNPDIEVVPNPDGP